MTAYLIDSSITPLHFMVSDELIVTDRARTILAADGWTAPEALPALLLDLATDIRNLPEIQHRMYIEQFCANRKPRRHHDHPVQPAASGPRVRREQH